MKNIAIIGAGFYGSNLAIDLARRDKNLNIVLFEKRDNILLGAVSNNQHRLHLGFHYPRCRYTTEQAIRSHSEFIKNYKESVTSPNKNIYLIHRQSKVSFEYFLSYYNEYGLECSPLQDREISKWIKDPKSIQGAIQCKEKVIDLSLLSHKIKSNLKNANSVEIRTGSKIENIEGNVLCVNGERLKFDHIINCSYSDLLLDSENEIRLKSELCFIPILKDEKNCLQNNCLTIMDGDFCSLYQTGAEKTVSLSSVRYTPFYKDESHLKLEEIKSSLTKKDIEDICEQILSEGSQHFLHVEKMKIIDCYITIKTKLLDDKNDYRGSYFIKNNDCITVLGGKISAYYDLRDNIIENILGSI